MWTRSSSLFAMLWNVTSSQAIATFAWVGGCLQVTTDTDMRFSQWFDVFCLTGALLGLAHPALRLEDGPSEGFYAASEAPKWRAAWALNAQVGVFPWLLRDDASIRTLIHVFLLWILMDFAIVDLSSLMLIHHLVTLGGTWCVLRISSPKALAWFANAVVVLELGSASVNIMCLYDSHWTRWFSLVCITGSNLCALGCTFMWRKHSHQVSKSLFCIMCLGLCGLLLGRQERAITVILRGEHF